MFKIINMILFKKIILFGLIGIILITSGYFLGKLYNTDQIQAKKEKHQKGYEYTSPLLECSYQETGTLETKSIQKRIENIIEENKNQKNISHVSVYVHDLINGTWVGINEKENFSPASLLKVPLMIAFLKQAEYDESILTKKIKVTEKPLGALDQSFIPFKSVEINKEYTIEELISYMITYSDNQAANTLLGVIDQNFLNQLFLDIGITPPSMKNPENYMAVIDYASFFEILYNASYLNKEMSEKALNILTKTGFQRGIIAGLPMDIKVAHKFGERTTNNYNQLHDCGIIYKPNHPFLLCVMTRGNDLAKMAFVIKDISRATYNEIK